MRPLSHATLALVLLCSACATVSIAQQERPWLRARTAHFTLYSDLPRERCEQHARELEQLLHAFLQHGWTVKGELGLQLNVAIFAHERDFRRFARGNFSGYFVPSALFEPWAVMPADDSPAMFDTLRHELTHHIAFSAMPNQPAWLAEGLAGFFETARFEGDQFVVGSVPIRHFRTLQYGGRLDAEALLTPWPLEERERHYATAWLLVHYLMSKRDEAFVGYQTALARGSAPELAFARFFPDLTVSALDRTLASYARRESYDTYAVSLQKPKVAVHTEELTRADLYALEAILESSCMDCQHRDEQVRANMRRALERDPMHLHANAFELLSVARHEPEQLARTAALCERHPHAWLAWFSHARLAHELAQPALALTAIRRAIGLAPRQPYPRLLAAEIYARAGQREDALECLDRAGKLAPSSSDVLRIQALLYRALQDCKALRATREKLHVLEHGKQDAQLVAAVTSCVEAR